MARGPYWENIARCLSGSEVRTRTTEDDIFPVRSRAVRLSLTFYYCARFGSRGINIDHNAALREQARVLANQSARPIFTCSSHIVMTSIK